MASHTPRLTTPRIPAESDLRRLISGREPPEFSKYIMQARNDVAYVGGTGVIDLKQFGFGVGRHLLRDVEMPDHSIYMTLDDHLREPVKLELGISASSRQVADFLLRQHSVRDMLIALAQLNRIRHMDDQLNELWETFTLSIPEKARPALNAAIANEAETHFFLARQTIMLAAREVILKGGSGVARPDGSPLMTAIMLTHALASDIGPLDESGPQIWPGMSVAALMELVANASFNTNEWWVSQLDPYGESGSDTGVLSTSRSPGLRSTNWCAMCWDWISARSHYSASRSRYRRCTGDTRVRFSCLGNS